MTYIFRKGRRKLPSLRLGFETRTSKRTMLFTNADRLMTAWQMLHRSTHRENYTDRAVRVCFGSKAAFIDWLLMAESRLSPKGDEESTSTYLTSTAHHCCPDTY